MRIRRFFGIKTRPDDDAVEARWNRNMMLGPDGTYIESRPGTRQLTRLTQPGADTGASGQNVWYILRDSELEHPILVIAAQGGTGASLGQDGLPVCLLPIPQARNASVVDNQGILDDEPPRFTLVLH